MISIKQKIIPTLLLFGIFFYGAINAETNTTLEILGDKKNPDLYLSIARAAEEMLKSTPTQSPLYQNLLRDVGTWYDKAGALKKAHTYYMLYLQEFSENTPEGKSIRYADDKLLLGLSDDPYKRIEQYDYIIDQYAGQDEAKMAYSRKAEALLDLNKNEEVIQLRENLLPNDPSLLQAGANIIKTSLEKGDCKSAAYIGNLLSDRMPLSQNEELGLFDCLLAEKQLPPARKIAETGATNEDATLKEEWLYRLGKVLNQMSEFPQSTFASRDALKIARTLNKQSHYDIAFTLFNSLIRQNSMPQSAQVEEARNLVPFLEQYYPKDERMLRVYRFMLYDAVNRKDSVSGKLYGQKLLEIADLFQNYEYTPWAEFNYGQFFIDDKNYQEALSIMQQAQERINRSKSASNAQQTQLHYLLGFLNHELGNHTVARQEYEQCANAQEESQWKSLCMQASSLLSPSDSNTTIPNDSNATTQ